MEDDKILLSIRNLGVKFRVRGRLLTAIRGVSLDIRENESIAIVGESGSGKSVFTKTFAGMLDSNGFISDGEIIFNDPQLADTFAKPNRFDRFALDVMLKALNRFSRLEFGAKAQNEIDALKRESREKSGLDEEEREKFEKAAREATFGKSEAYNRRLTLGSKERAEARRARNDVARFDAELKRLKRERRRAIAKKKAAARRDAEGRAERARKIRELRATRRTETKREIGAETIERNMTLGKEIYLSVGRYPFRLRYRLLIRLLVELRRAMRRGVDLDDEERRNAVFDKVVFRVRFLDGTTEEGLHGNCMLNLAKIKYSGDWQKIRGTRIATIFQDPMTSLNPVLTIGKQISSIIIKHQRCSEVEARRKAVELMKKVEIPDAENRYDDYPFQYSGGMRQRIVIAIALSCQPKILICDEPTTALDVTIQAQILRLIKDLQKEFGYTIVFITHDLGVVANIAERVAVMYAGQIVELGTVEDIFYDPRHPYTWALLSSLPQLAEKDSRLYSISGTPPSLYNKIVGDSFAPRNPYCLRIDTLKESPVFKVSDAHWAKTWLLDPRAPKIEKPEAIRDIHGKLIGALNIEEEE